MRMPAWLNSRLDVLRSRCRIQLSCRCFTPRSSWIMSVFTSPKGGGLSVAPRGLLSCAPSRLAATRLSGAWSPGTGTWGARGRVAGQRSPTPEDTACGLGGPRLGSPHGDTAPTWQEGLLHGLHQALEVVLHVVHDDVNLVHVAAHDYLLESAAGPARDHRFSEEARDPRTETGDSVRTGELARGAALP